MSSRTSSTAWPRPADDWLDGASLIRIIGIAGVRAGGAGQSAVAPADGAALSPAVERSDRDGAPPPAAEQSDGDGAIALADAPGKAEGDGALRIITGSDAPTAVGVALGEGGGGIRLGELGAVSFDYYLGDGAAAAPAVRLVIDADGDLSTTGDRVQLVFQHAGQDGDADSWRSADLADGGWLGWQYADGRNLDGGADTVGLDRWASDKGYKPQGGYKLDANSLVLDCFLVVQVEEKPGVVFIDNLQIGAAVYDFTI